MNRWANLEEKSGERNLSSLFNAASLDNQRLRILLNIYCHCADGLV